MIPARIMLRALAYILHGRADWLDRKAVDNRKAIGPSVARPGRLAGRDQHSRQASEVGRMSHDHAIGGILLSPALVGLTLIRATGHLELDGVLRQEMRAAGADVALVLNPLIVLGVLPRLEVTP